MRRFLFLLVLMFGVAYAQTSAPDSSLTLTSAQQERAASIEQKLRCPICQGESVYDSRAQISGSIRDEVAAQVVAGTPDASIYSYFQGRYGDSILMQPPVRGVNLWLWGLPVVVVLIGGAWLLGFLRRRPTPPDDPDPESLARLDAELDARRRQP